MLNTKTEIFQGDFKVGGSKIIADIKIGDLENIKFTKPPFQREGYSDKINEIIKCQENYFKKYNGKFNFFDNIIINCCDENKKNYLIDGQHRYEAANELFKKGYKNISLRFEIDIVKTFDEVKENFQMINKNTQQPEWPDDIDKNIPEQTARYFFVKYPKIFNLNKRPKKPYINKINFEEAVGYLLSELNKESCKEHDKEDLIKIINDKNETVSKWTIERWNIIRKIKSWSEIKVIADEYGFHLGMFKKEDEDYMYNWVKQIISQQTGTEIKKKKRTRKKKIPPTIKEEVWTKWKGNIHKAACHCCRLKEIASTSFHGGHIIPESSGGKTTVENLRPICQSCNSSMGKRDMKEYIKEFYSDNLSKLDECDTQNVEESNEKVVNKEDNKPVKSKKKFLGVF
jgi:5-methylcytosine-specific restriction endonuclease McrA